MPREISKSTMRNSDRAWVTLASDVAAYDPIAAAAEQLSNAARRYFKSQPIGTALMILVTGLHLVGGIPPWRFRSVSFRFSTGRYLRLCFRVLMASINGATRWSTALPPPGAERRSDRLMPQVLAGSYDSRFVRRPSARWRGLPGLGSLRLG
jgi:hypothetical protein